MHKRYGHNGALAQFIVDRFPNRCKGYGIDVGASDGLSVNSTWALEKYHQWTILSVEPNPEFHEELVKRRAWVAKCACDSEPGENRIFRVHTDNPEAYSALRPIRHPEQHPDEKAKWTTIRVPVRTIDQLLEQWAFPKLDLLCVDVEGNELDVLKGCDLKRWHPEMVIVESWDAGLCDEYLKPFGYTRVGRHVYNDIYMLGIQNKEVE